MFRNSLSAEGAKAVTIKAWAPKARMLMPNLGWFVRLCVRLTILDLLKVYMNMFLRFFRFKFFKFLNRLCVYGSNGLWSGATPISDGIFVLVFLYLYLVFVLNTKVVMLMWQRGDKDWEQCLLVPSNADKSGGQTFRQQIGEWGDENFKIQSHLLYVTQQQLWKANV